MMSREQLPRADVALVRDYFSRHNRVTWTVVFFEKDLREQIQQDEKAPSRLDTSAAAATAAAEDVVENVSPRKRKTTIQTRTSLRYDRRVWSRRRRRSKKHLFLRWHRHRGGRLRRRETGNDACVRWKL